ncbi:MAG: hypothetical protein AAFN74_10755, partial [Myxococcota bacterium]
PYVLGVFIAGNLACLLLFMTKSHSTILWAAHGAFLLWLGFGTQVMISAAKIAKDPRRSGTTSDGTIDDVLTDERADDEAIDHTTGGKGPRTYSAARRGYSVAKYAVGSPALLLILANSVSPYFELKYSFSFNMYSNLRAEGGHSNNLLLKKTWPLTRYATDYAQVLDSNEPALLAYRDENYGIPLVQLNKYLYEHPSAKVTYQHSETVYEQKQAGDAPHFGRVPSLFETRLHVFRAIDLNQKRRCYADWLAAH